MLPESLSVGLKNSKLPILKKVGAILMTTQHVSVMTFPEYKGSLVTPVSDVTSEGDLVVGMPR